MFKAFSLKSMTQRLKTATERWDTFSYLLTKPIASFSYLNIPFCFVCFSYCCSWTDCRIYVIWWCATLSITHRLSTLLRYLVSCIISLSVECSTQVLCPCLTSPVALVLLPFILWNLEAKEIVEQVCADGHTSCSCAGAVASFVYFPWSTTLLGFNCLAHTQNAYSVLAFHAF